MSNVMYNNQNAAEASLTHARTMLVYAADQRLKDFNTFVIVAGILVAAVAKLEPGVYTPTVFVAGTVFSLAFLVLDLRAVRLIKDARADLYRFEEMFGIEIHAVDRIADPSRKIGASGRFRPISHTYAFRTVHVFTLLMCLWALVR